LAGQERGDSRLAIPCVISHGNGLPRLGVLLAEGHCLHQPDGSGHRPSSQANHGRPAGGLIEEFIMKTFPLTLIALLIAAGGSAQAAESTQGGTLPGITVKQDSNLLRNACKPPAYAAECESLHAQVRKNFSKREIVLLFGAGSALPEYRTSYASTQARYEEFLREIDLYGAARSTASIE
jgi:hypothetical protein